MQRRSFLAAVLAFPAAALGRKREEPRPNPYRIPPGSTRWTTEEVLLNARPPVSLPKDFEELWYRSLHRQYVRERNWHKGAEGDIYFVGSRGGDWVARKDSGKIERC